MESLKNTSLSPLLSPSTFERPLSVLEGFSVMNELESLVSESHQDLRVAAAPQPPAVTPQISNPPWYQTTPKKTSSQNLAGRLDRSLKEREKMLEWINQARERRGQLLRSTAIIKSK